jgi:WD40 repeat protein
MTRLDYRKMANWEQELGSDLKLFCWDARRFMISQGSVITRNPLQIYCSALIFSPKNSLVCRASSEETPSWLLRYRSPVDQWDQCILNAPGSRYETPIVFSPDSNRIAILSECCVEIWSIKCGVPIDSFEVLPKGKNLLFSPDGKHLALIVDEARIWLYDTSARTIDYILETQNGRIEKFLFSPNGVYLISNSQYQVTIWTLANGELYWSSTTRGPHDILEKVTDDTGPNPDYAPTLEVSNDSSMIATVSPHNFVTVRNIETKSLHSQIPLGDIDESVKLGFSTNDDLIIVKGTRVISWDSKSNALYTVILSIGNSDSLKHWLSPDRSTIATLKDRCSLFLCNATTGICSRQISYTSYLRTLCFSRDSTRLALLSNDEIDLYDAMTAGYVGTLPVLSDSFAAVHFSPDGSMLAHEGYQYQTKILDVSVPVMSSRFVREKGSYILQTRLSVDGTMVLYARQRLNESTATELYLLDVLEDVFTIIDPGFLVNNFSISPDKNYLIAQGQHNFERRSRLYNLQDKTSSYIDSAGVAAFSTSSQLLAIAGLDSKVRIWDIASPESKVTLDGHSCAIGALEFSHSDAKLASTDITGRTMIWHCQSGSLEADSRHHGQPAGGLHQAVLDTAFSSDGSMFAYTFHNQEINRGYLWGLETNTLLDTFAARTNGWSRQDLSFSDDGRYLRLFSTTIDLWPFASPCLDMGQPLEYTMIDGWIKWQGRKVLRPPDDWISARCDSRGNKLAMVNRKGEVAFIEFDPQELRKALGI